MEWKEHGGSYRIVQLRTGVDPQEREQWPRQHAWLSNQLERYHETFSQAITELAAEQASSAIGVPDRPTVKLAPSPASPGSTMMIPAANDLEGRTLTVAAEFRGANPRRPGTHGWLAFEILRRAPGSSLRFEEYARRLFDPDGEIQALARAIPGQRNAYQHYKHIRCDIFRHAVRVSPPLDDEWYRVQRCSSGANPYGNARRTSGADS
jgi:hypothetical protein